MITVTICKEVLEPDQWLTYSNVTENVCDFLLTKFDVWPEAARLYLSYVSDSTDITPHTEEEIKNLTKIDNAHFYVCLWPNDPVTIGIIVAIAVAAVSIAIAFLFRPKNPATQEHSPNNQLSDRQNKPRPNERIPYIVGTVRSTPDLIQFPYKVFNPVTTLEEEHSYMCVGVGSFTIVDCRDGNTDLDYIDGDYVGVYGPGTSPNNTSAPAQTFGTLPTTIPKIVSVVTSNSVNGQVLRPPNFGTLNTDNNVGFAYPNQMTTNGNLGLDFTDYFVASTVAVPQYLIIYGNDDGINASDPGEHISSVGLQGTYQILDVTSSSVTLSNPAAVNTNWNIIATFTGQVSAYNHSFQVVGNATPWIGPYVLPSLTMTEVWFNFVASSGLYYIDGDGNQHKMSVAIQVGVQAVDQNNNPIGDEIFGVVNMTGSRKQQIQVGATLKFVLPTPGPVRVRAQRLTNQGTDHNDTYVEQIQWRDLYQVTAVSQTDFGNVTTIQTITIPTQDALSIKERKINMLVTRNLPTWNNRLNFGYAFGYTSGTFTTALYPTNNAADIICAMALDPFVGRRTLAELDTAGIYAVADSSIVASSSGRLAGAIHSYYGTGLPTEFCYTFDDSKVSFEESMADICSAIGCTAYRQGSVLSINFEQKTSASKLLFNHRNKLPKSETRTVTFGTLDDNDGIEYTFVDTNAPNAPNVDTTTTLYFPVNQSAINPKKVESRGVRNRTQALLNGWRMYQKLFYQNTQTEFTATTEAALLVNQDRILVADNTRPDTQDGYIVNQIGSSIVTSQPLILDSTKTYTIFLQHYDGTVQSMGIANNTPQPTTPNGIAVMLSSPTLPLVLDEAVYAQTTYQIVSSSDVEVQAFLVASKSNQKDLTYKVTASNYDDNYYNHDTDVLTGAIIPNPIGFGPQGFTGSGYNGPFDSSGAPVVFTSRMFSTSDFNSSVFKTINNPGTMIIETTGNVFIGDGANVETLSITNINTSAGKGTGTVSGGGGSAPINRPGGYDSN